jgi:2'-5' RNA ligase
MHRLFVAIRPPEEVRDLLIDAMDDSPDLRWVPEDNLHLTLRFIGEVERPLAEDIAAALANVHAPALMLKISGVNSFAQRSGGALWAGVQPPDGVAALAKKIERACITAGLEPEHRRFHPHITLARWSRRSRRAADAFLERNRALASEPFEASSFTLFESRLSRHGALYEPVKDYPLDQALATTGPFSS